MRDAREIPASLEDNYLNILCQIYHSEKVQPAIDCLKSEDAIIPTDLPIVQRSKDHISAFPIPPPPLIAIQMNDIFFLKSKILSEAKE